VTDPGIEARCQALREKLAPRDQMHVFRWWDELDNAQRRHLLGQLESIAWDQLDPIIASHVQEAPKRDIPRDLRPAAVLPRVPDQHWLKRYRGAEKRARQLLKRGAVAAFTVAGGQATRLGVDVPKGTIPVTPVGDRSLFELFAGMVWTAGAKYGSAVPWYIMTSEANHAATVNYFREHNHFGLPPDDVTFFQQGMLPAFTRDGRLILDEKHSLAMAPDGHGGALKALVRSGAVRDMQKRGVEMISYFQVDNPLVKPFDPLFLGLHDEIGSEMSTKVARKADDLERVGNVCMADGRVVVIEYSEFPEELARARNADGSRMFDAANLAIHVLGVDFVSRVAGESFQLPFRRAEKAVPFVNESGRRVLPDRPNAVKLETFVFDALPLAKNPLVLDTDRQEEFSPVKNATGPDSLGTAKRDQVLRAVRWLSRAGVSVPRDSSGEPDLVVAISPRFALDSDDVKEKSHLVPPLRPGHRIYVE